MRKITEIEVNVSKGRIIKSSIQKNGSCKIVVELDEIETKEKQAEVLIEASKLSLEDKFMKHNPKTEQEKKFKKLLEEVIKRGVKDFWRPTLDPSFNEDKSGICYIPGSRPAVGKSYNWWKERASGYNPKRGSRLGTKAEYVAFLGVLIKRLISEGWTVENAWNAVCNDSKQLGHYWNSENAKQDFEPTGSRKVCGFFDLANTCKILAEDKEAGGFWLAGGSYGNNSRNYPLADLYHYDFRNNDNNVSVGWLVLEKR